MCYTLDHNSTASDLENNLIIKNFGLILLAFQYGIIYFILLIILSSIIFDNLIFKNFGLILLAFQYGIIYFILS